MPFRTLRILGILVKIWELAQQMLRGEIKQYVLEKRYIRKNSELI